MAVDLSVERLEMEPGSVGDTSITTSIQVTNRGENDSGSFTLTLGLTLDRMIGNTDDVIISVESVTGLAAGFSISAVSTDDTPVKVPPGNYFGFLVVRLDDNSTDADPANDNLITSTRVFRSGDAAGEIAVRGAGLLISSGDMTPRPADHTHFGRFKPVTPYRNRAFVVTNTGQGALNVGAVTIDGPGSASFSIKKRPDSILLPGASSRLVLRFDPISAGLHNATVSIASSAASDPSYEFAIRGRGIRPGLVRLAFGDRVIALEGETVGIPVRLSNWIGDGKPTFVVSNTGPRKVYLAGARITPYGVPPFFQTDPHFTIHENPTGYLRRGASVSFQITADGPSEVGIMNLYVYLAGFWSTQISFLIDD